MADHLITPQAMRAPPLPQRRRSVGVIIADGMDHSRASTNLRQRKMRCDDSLGGIESHQRNWRQKLYNFGGLLSRVAGGDARENQFALASLAPLLILPAPAIYHAAAALDT